MEDVKELWVPTWSGRKINVMNPNPDSIVLSDIAEHLAKINRYVGGTIRPYSVAEHSLRLGHVAEKLLGSGNGRYWMICGLLHDGHEYVMGDQLSMIARAMGYCLLDECKAIMDTAIENRFCVQTIYPPALRELDRLICQVEIHDSGLFSRPYTLAECSKLAGGINQDTRDRTAVWAALQDFDRGGWFRRTKWGMPWQVARDRFLEKCWEVGLT